MNVKQFKNIIKGCIREVLHEELPDILNEHLQTNGQLLQEGTHSFTSADVGGGNIDTLRNTLRSRMSAAFGEQQAPNLKVKPEADNPLMDFILDAGKNMTAQDRQGLRQLGD